MDETVKRAIAAWFRSGGNDQPAEGSSGIRNHNGEECVVVKNIKGNLAVYRIKNDGRLKRIN